MPEPAVTPDVVDLLRRQHNRIKLAFAAAMLPGPGRAGRFERLRRLLAVHEAGEEAHVHPVIRKLGHASNVLVRNRLGEERTAKKLLKDLEKRGPGGPGYIRRLWALQGAVLAHARREEREEFPVLLKAISPARRRMLGAEVLATQKLAPTRPRPLLSGQLANKLTAPLLGPLDRARDKVAARKAS